MDADPTYATTRRALQGVAELLLAGPQHAACGKITLRALAGGFGTTHTPDVRVEGTAVVAGDHRAEIDGLSARELGERIGVRPQPLAHVYRDGSGVAADERLDVDARAAARVASAYATGDAALRAFDPSQTPILWPEHFDIGITLDQVNYGVSPGDSAIPGPYMYVGPWNPPAVDGYWNHAFGAARPLAASADEVTAFFEEARERLNG